MGSGDQRLVVGEDSDGGDVTKLEEVIRQGGCYCDPPGSGEEFCIGTCFLRKERDDLRQALTAAWGALKGCRSYMFDTGDDYGEHPACRWADEVLDRGVDDG